MTANKALRVRTGQAVPDCPQLSLQVRGGFVLSGRDLSRAARNHADLRLLRLNGPMWLTPVHLRKCGFDLSRTGRERTPFALVKLSRTGQDRFRPGSRRTVPLSLSMGEGTGPSPRGDYRIDLRNRIFGDLYANEGRVSVGRQRKRKNEIAPGTLALICDGCDTIVNGRSQQTQGYLVCENGRWSIWHDACKSPGSRPVIRESQVSSYPLLLTTLAAIAAEANGFCDTNWPTLLRRIVSDTEWHFDPEGGQKTVSQMMADNSAAYRSAGLTQKLTEDRRA